MSTPETTTRKRTVMPLKKVIDMADWYLADNRQKFPCRVLWRCAKQLTK
jgi:hypothetical protein